MKKNYFFGLFAATMLLTTSCQQENIFTEMWGEKEQTVTLNIALPEMGTATRAYGTGLNAKYLQYAVYSLDDQGIINKLIEKTDVTMTVTSTNPPSTSIKLKLVPGTDYSLVLWADAYGNDSNSPFEVKMEDDGTTTMKIKSGIVKTNDDTPDAFFGSFVVAAGATGGFQITDVQTNEQFSGDDIHLKLKRPFAQLNIAATNSDLELAQKSDFTISQTAVSIASIKTYDTLDLRTGEVDGASTEMHYLSGNLPGNMQTTGNATHTLLAMNYILMAADKETVTVTFNYYGDQGQEGKKTYTNVPLRRNWRTNIYGELFTKEVGITIEIAPGFADQIDADGDNHPDTDNHYSGENGFPLPNP